MKPQLAVIRGLVVDIEYNGRIVEIIERIPSNTSWVAPDGDFFDPEEGDGYAVISLGRPFLRENMLGGFSMYACFYARNVFPLHNNPGNESWFTAAPRSKPATTKGDTIDARGMVRS